MSDPFQQVLWCVWRILDMRKQAQKWSVLGECDAVCELRILLEDAN